jgi:hypothetical protein
MLKPSKEFADYTDHTTDLIHLKPIVPVAIGFFITANRWINQIRVIRIN